MPETIAKFRATSGVVVGRTFVAGNANGIGAASLDARSTINPTKHVGKHSDSVFVAAHWPPAAGSRRASRQPTAASAFVGVAIQQARACARHARSGIPQRYRDNVQGQGQDQATFFAMGITLPRACSAFTFESNLTPAAIRIYPSICVKNGRSAPTLRGR
jgi:hypothetical protein